MSSITEEDVRRIIGESLTERQSSLDPQSVQWLVRSAYEEGWRDGGGDETTSHHSEAAVGWRAAWFSSKARAILVRNRMISGEDAYR